MRPGCRPSNAEAEGRASGRRGVGWGAMSESMRTRQPNSVCQTALLLIGGGFGVF